MHKYIKLISQFRTKSTCKAVIVTAVCLAITSCGEGIRLEKVGFSDLPNWNESQVIGSKVAFSKSCEVILNNTSPSETPFLNEEPLGKYYGSIGQWQKLCKQFQLVEAGDLKNFFERSFQPLKIQSESTGLFTGYYVPVVNGSLVKTSTYNVQLLQKPDDLISINLQDFDKSLPKQTLIARTEKGKAKPYFTRNEMLKSNAKPLLWLENDIDKFFLQIQGSGKVRLPNGDEVGVGYAMHNGRPYTAIGKILIEKGELSKDQVSMPAIRKWLADNPSQAKGIMDSNERYIFFSKTNGIAKGAGGIELTPERSMAIDPKFIPYGTPVFVDTYINSKDNELFQQLMIAQDTGSAINGHVRGDIFFGEGKEAAKLAGHQAASGNLYVLVPRN